MALPLSYNVRNLRVRWRLTMLAVLGIAAVVSVFVVLVAMAAGFARVLATTGIPQNGIVVQRGSVSEMTSGMSRQVASQIMVDSRVARGADGHPLASPEIVVAVSMRRSTDGEPTNVLVRGVTPTALVVRNGIRIEQGRAFTPGLAEIIVGRRIRDRITGLALGRVVTIQRREWRIVGIFSAGGSGFESEVWGDLDVMAQAFNRMGGYSSLALRLSDPSMRPAFDQEIRRNPQMQLQLNEERAYYEGQAGLVGPAMWALAGFVAIVMGVGASFGAMNTMYAIVAARTREIGTLRALGFSRLSVLTAFVLESSLLALVGGLLGCALALPANGLTGATANATFSELAFAFQITPPILLGGMAFALLMGVAGGLLPAFRAARLPIASALRAA